MIFVEIKNFQSIESLEFRIEGFTALVGRSNIGKSAIVRALKCALTGAEGVDFVRHDPSTCTRILRETQKCKCASSVRLDFGDGRKILWEKGDSINQYTVWEDGKQQIYNSVGKNPELPGFLKEDFAQVQVGDKKLLLQVSDQFNPIFLLNLGGTTIADVLSDVAKLDEINVAMRMASKDRKEASSTRKVREKDVQDLEVDLQRYDGLDGAVGRSRKVESSFETLREKTATLQQLDSFRQTLMTVGSEVKTLLNATKPVLPDARALSSKSVKFVEVAGFQEDWTGKAKAFKRLVGVSDLSIPDNKLEEIFDLYQRLCVWATKGKTLFDDVESFQSLPELKFSCAPADFQVLRDRLVAVANFAVRLKGLETTIATTSGSLDTATKEELQVRQEFQELGVCSTCNQVISPDHLVC